MRSHRIRSGNPVYRPNGLVRNRPERTTKRVNLKVCDPAITAARHFNIRHRSPQVAGLRSVRFKPRVRRPGKRKPAIEIAALLRRQAVQMRFPPPLKGKGRKGRAVVGSEDPVGDRFAPLVGFGGNLHGLRAPVQEPLI
jgi:hypothetical protein